MPTVTPEKVACTTHHICPDNIAQLLQRIALHNHAALVDMDLLGQKVVGVAGEQEESEAGSHPGKQFVVAHKRAVQQPELTVAMP